MKSLRIYDILSEDGQSVEDVILQVPMEYTWDMVFEIVWQKTGVEIDSYSYEEINT